MMSKYEVNIRCMNCGYRGKMEIWQGYSVHFSKCPKCDLSKVLELDEIIIPLREGDLN